MSVGKKLAALTQRVRPGPSCVQFHEDAADAPNVLKGLRLDWSPYRTLHRSYVPQIAEKPVPDNPMECVEEELLVYKVLETYCVAISALLWVTREEIAEISYVP